MEQFMELNTDQMEPPTVDGSLMMNRSVAADFQQQAAVSEVTILVQGFNRFDKTRRCVESILQYTDGIDYNLILIDNGSTDETLEYFKSVSYDKKYIIHATKNVGSGYPGTFLNCNMFGKFLCIIPNDLILTKNWLKNLLICINSDSKIGMVNPVCCNTSNLQGVDLPYTNYEEMQQLAARFNRSDPQKWEDRQRLITLGTLYRKEAILAAGWPLGDAGFFHDFSDDDITFTIRRLGYRTVLAGDTWVCHDHDVYHGEGKDPVEFNKSLEIGRANFKEKYFGVDAWDDVNNYYIPYMKFFPAPTATNSARVLGIDVRCGTPILDIKNWLRKNSVFNTELSSFTEDPKYWLDLKTICSGQVICDREEFLTDSFLSGYFDYVIADRPVNRYHEPQKILNDMFALCKNGGIVVCKLKNAFSFQEYANLLGQWGVYDPEFSYNIPFDVFRSAIEGMGAVKATVAIPFTLDNEQSKSLLELLPKELPNKQKEEVFQRMKCKEYLFIVEKN